MYRAVILEIMLGIFESRFKPTRNPGITIQFYLKSLNRGLNV